jgi:hypothetical protein
VRGFPAIPTLQEKHVTNSTTATVETLTAEVRVLMVGSRQVTLSVYSQLDAVPLMAMTPFGRVRVKETSYSGWTYIRVVGAGRDGRLVASWLGHATGSSTFADPAGVWANLADAEHTWDELEDLPLIVLAGLR